MASHFGAYVSDTTFSMGNVSTFHVSAAAKRGRVQRGRSRWKGSVAPPESLDNTPSICIAMKTAFNTLGMSEKARRQ